ncbi:MAG: glucosyl-3-phosphoglycerate synthase [Actinomycetes bacterium]
MQQAAQEWFRARTYQVHTSTLAGLADRKGEASVSVVLPALNEQETVGAIVSTIRESLVDIERPIVDELVVVDSGSHDDTAHRAAAAGARVVHVDSVLPDVPSVPGKGEALWRSLAATTGDVVVFVDADLLAFSPLTVTGLLGPLFGDPSIQLVKATYDRPFTDGGRMHPAGGGRVTELVARPLLNLHWPLLAGFVQPLAGEYAARRSLLETLPFATGYGVEIGLLIDALDAVGLDALAQVDLGERRHRHHDDQRLGRMAAEIWQTALSRLQEAGGFAGAVDPTLTQFTREADGPDRARGAYRPVTHEVTALERPPMCTVTGYADGVSRSGSRS